ncbi:hypothetical protein SAMN05660350_00464 [Geodermatophilus obscurus]|uniref:Uncharacterized protein n=1 Tax=Geodermatophilus obscurus TaxID=1861 RepID=A0A1M7S3S2_9ACTN|nr:hypothetical protein [Geodermatophilus obscurus]SHN53138.1 hypothetical protein SAMN05660350_00464 [Geodermatophilus obscurus]
MKVQAYPFAVARNRTLDWRPLIAPAPLITAGQDFALVLETAGQHPLDLVQRTWTDSSSRPWLLAYHSVPATRALISADGTDQLTDRFGRPIFLVEGVACPQVRSLPAGGAKQLVDQVHTRAADKFREFWECEDEEAPAQATQALEAEIKDAEPALGPLWRSAASAAGIAASATLRSIVALVEARLYSSGTKVVEERTW